MSETYSTFMHSHMRPGLCVEQRLATEILNQDEQARIIAMRAYEAFCLRGCEHGSDLDDWLNAERELSPAADDVMITQSEAGLDISIAERDQQANIVLSVAPSSLLILWIGTGTDSALSLSSFPELADPEALEVAYRDGRVWLHLPYVANGDASSEPDISLPHERTSAATS